MANAKCKHREQNQSQSSSDGGADGSGRDSDFWIDDKGRLCFGLSCLTLVADPEKGIRFDLKVDECDPETRERLVAAAVRGAKLRSISEDDDR